MAAISPMMVRKKEMTLMNKGGFLLFVTITEFFEQILKMNSDGQFEFKLGDCYMLICSRDLTTDVVRSAGSVNDFQSKYANVEFISSLLPDVEMMEYATTSGSDTFFDMYVNKLYDPSRMKDVISICDIVARRDIPVFVIMTSLDMRTGYPEILKEFIKEEFSLQGYTMDDLKGKSIPDVVYEIGDKSVIAKEIDDHVDKLLKETDKEYFLNSLIDDVEKVYRDVLETKSVDELRQMADARMIFISRRDDKKRIIDKLINSIMSSDDTM